MTQKTIVYVLNKKGEPLMPTTRCGHVRKLLKNGKAVTVNNCPFTIRLKYETANIKQSICYGIDTGRENIGAGVSDDKGNCLYLSNAKTNNKTIKINMHHRAMYRKVRKRCKRIKKQRKSIRDNTTIKNGKDDFVRTTRPCKSKDISYPGMAESYTHKVIRCAEAQFNNRKWSEGWLPPSARQLIQLHILMIENIRKFLPITNVSLERVCFDFQKLENEDIEMWEYSKGPLYGYNNYSDYVYDRQGGKCAICGCKHIDEYHHIIPRSKGGTDRVKNIIGLCQDCHVGIAGVHKNREVANQLLELKKKISDYSISLLNSVMPTLINMIREYCDKNSLVFTIVDGFQTATIRDAIGLQKNNDTHCMDAYCVSLAHRTLPNLQNVRFPTIVYQQRRSKKKSNNNIKALDNRNYYYDGKLVAINRHKAIEQNEDSLEEYMAKYMKKHTQLECARHLHCLIVCPAKRKYTYHKNKEIAPIHSGDKVKYEKKCKTRSNITSVFIAEFIRRDKDSGEWTISHDGTKEKKSKFCRMIESGCIPYIGCIPIHLLLHCKTSPTPNFPTSASNSPTPSNINKSKSPCAQHKSSFLFFL